MFDTSLQPLILMLLSNYKNDNEYMRFLPILIVILSFFYNIIPFKEIHNMIYEFIKRENQSISIIIPSHEVPIVRSLSTTPITKLIYSTTFLSIVHYLSTNKRCKIHSLTEIMTNNTELNCYYVKDDETDWRKKDQFMFIPISNEKFLISENPPIFCEFNEIKYEEKEEIMDKNKNKNNVIVPKSKRFVIILSLKSVDERDLIILEEFVKNCLEEYNRLINKKKDTHSQYIFEYKTCEKEDNKLQLVFDEFPLQNNKDLLKNIFFEEKEKLIQYITPFIYNSGGEPNPGEEKYKRSGFTFKAGILFYGSPGCGKTSTIKAILNYTKRHAIVINLGKVKTCEELQSIFRKRTINGRELDGKQICYILEDCDAFENKVIQSRNTVDETGENERSTNNEISAVNKLFELSESTVKIMNKQEDSLNLSCFLNILDGIIELHGIMIIMTTNYPEKIDEALIRPGRFDFKYEFKKTTKRIIKEMIQFKYDLSDEEMMEYKDELLNIKNDVLSPAEIQSICFKNENVKDCIVELLLLMKNI